MKSWIEYQGEFYTWIAKILEDAPVGESEYLVSRLSRVLASIACGKYDVNETSKEAARIIRDFEEPADPDAWALTREQAEGLQQLIVRANTTAAYGGIGAMIGENADEHAASPLNKLWKVSYSAKLSADGGEVVEELPVAAHTLPEAYRLAAEQLEAFRVPETSPLDGGVTYVDVAIWDVCIADGNVWPEYA